MYINDVHILWYVIVFAIGAIIGQFTEWINKRILDNKKIFSKYDFKNYFKKKTKINYTTVLIISILYLIGLYVIGVKDGILNNLELIKYLTLVPMLISIIMIDYKKKIVPNRLTLTIFETGIIFTFLYAINNLFLARDYFIAMILGGLIFGFIALIGRVITGKEAMGMGDIKLIAGLGLYFGIPLTISITIISFIIAALFGIVLIALKKKKNSEYIVFGPAIAISAILCMLIPKQVIISALLTIFTLGRMKT